MKVSEYILSWDFVISIVVTLITVIVLPSQVLAAFTISVYNIGITVLSIVFSLFFAALAILITNQDEKFLIFLDEDSEFQDIILGFRFTLISLFASLLYSIIIFTYTDFCIKEANINSISVSIIPLVIFEFCFLYSLISTLLCVLDTIKFSLLRVDFIKRSRE